MAITVGKEPAPPPGKLRKGELYGLSVGQVIGAGVITLIVPALKMTGYSAWLAYGVAIIFGFFIVCPMLFVTSTVRLGAGNYSIITDFMGPKLGGIFAFTFLVSTFAISLFGVASAEYLGDSFPAIGSPLAKQIVGFLIVTLFYVINLCGVEFMAKVSKYMTIIFLCCLGMFIIFGIANIKLPIFEVSSPKFFEHGFIKFENGMFTGGFAGAVLLYVYSCQGYYMVSAYGRYAANAKRDIPWAIYIAIPSLLIVYVGVAIAASGSLSIEDYGRSTSLVYAARLLMPTPLFYLFLIGGPIFVLTSTLNSSLGYNAISMSRSCQDGWLPKRFAEKNRFGSYKWILTFMYLMGIIPILLRFNVTTITNQIQLVASVNSTFLIIAYSRLPEKYPDAWKRARFHIPNGAFYALVTLSMTCNLIIFWKSLLSINISIVIASLLALGLCVSLGIWRGKTGNIRIITSVWDEDTDTQAVKTAS